MRKIWGQHWFTLSLPLVFLLAWFAPQLASRGGLLRPEITTQIGVTLIFLIQGLTLPSQALRTGLFHWRFHLLIQGFVFLGFPLLGLLFDRLLGPSLPPDLRLGLLYLCVLPSTISSASVLTATAHGNVAGAVCAAILSSLLGVVLTPLWATATLNAADHPIAFGPVLLTLGRLIVLPLLAGQLLRLTPARAWAEARKKPLGNLSTSVILFIVFAAFCDAAESRIWTRHGPSLLLLAFAGAVGYFAMASAIVALLSRFAGLSAPDKRAAQFCAVQKTLASGVPMATLIFGTHPGLGVILLPLLIYHPLQLTLQGLLANKWGRTAEKE